MTNSERCREEFEKWGKHNDCFDAPNAGFNEKHNQYDCDYVNDWWNMWQYAQHLATQATAQRCVEICDEVFNYCPEGVVVMCEEKISAEFGLQVK